MVKIGFIGIGVMGKPMAENLLRAGYSLSIDNRHREKSEALVSLGATIAESPQDVARGGEVVVTMLPDTQAVEQVLFGEKGVAEGLRPGSTVIDMSTIAPAATVAFSGRLGSQGCEMLDAPVSGGQKGAVAGTLGIMVGGSRDTFEKCLPIFQALGKTITYTGPSGHGQKTKLVNQLVGATNLLAAVEGLRLAHAAGLSLETTLRAVSSGAASSWMLTNLAPMIINEDFAPGFSIRLQHKDLKLLKEWVSELGVEFPAADLVYSLFSRALDMGLENQGNQGLINVWKR
ncbi:MAG: NAD(P)-dependent oxidoreductase [Acidobacteriaceae bacterium]